MTDYMLNINATDAEGNVAINNEDGSKVLWDEGGIKFFHPSFPTTPIWYNKKVAFGTSEHNDYIQLTGWDRAPSVHVSLKNMPLYRKDYSNNKQVLDIRATNVTKNGFTIIASLITPTSQYTYDETAIAFTSDYHVLVEDWSKETDDNCTRMVINLERYFNEVGNGAGRWRVYLYKYNGSSWVQQSKLYERIALTDERNIFFTLDTGTLATGKYKIKVDAYNEYSPGDSAATWIAIRKITQYYTNKNLATGEVNWIAVENTQ